jgi:hypothetical protein
MDMGLMWQNRMQQAAETASRYDPGLFSRKSRFRVGCIEKFRVTHKKKQSLCIYVSMILFITSLLKGKETIKVIDNSRVLKELLPKWSTEKSGTTKSSGKW